jgi:hypothetical protein
VSTGIPYCPLTLSPWDGSLAYRWTHDISAGVDFIAIPPLSRRGKTRPTSAARSPCLREETARMLTQPWVDSLCTSERWSCYVALSCVSIVRICRSCSSGKVWYPRMFYLLLARERPSGPSKALAWRKLWWQTLHRLHTVRRCGFPLQYYKRLCDVYSGKSLLYFGKFSCLR